MIVHRLLDAFFRTLDTIDAVRDRVDRALGREPRPDPWAVEWPPPAETPVGTEPPGGEPAEAPPPAAKPAGSPPAEKAAGEKGAGKGAASKKAAGKQAAGEKSEGKKAESKSGAKKAPAKKKPGRKKKSSSKRKGSVDRSGKDLVSERADEVVESLKGQDRPTITEEADLSGKRVLARVVWALGEAHAAGVDGGLTTNDISALLSRAAGIEVFATNIGRACRDHKDLIAEAAPDGRSKRYVLTDAGRGAAADVETTP